MQYTLALLGLAAAVSAQGVTSAIAPKASMPAGCMSTYSGTFEIETVNASTVAKRELSARQADVLMITLKNGILTDAKGRTGYIAANNQFQFDSPPQTGAIYTAGWSVCSNGTLAIGGTALFQQCLTGNFYNLYLNSTGAQCTPIFIDVIPASGASAAVSQITDGQVQATSAAVTQISDGQIQATSAKPVTQISDGQIQATTARAPVTQISDGQIQAPTAKPVTQISDGQIQATTAKALTTSKAGLVSQISDGQIQATSAKSGTATTTAAVYTGAANHVRGEIFGLAAGVVAVALL